VRADKIRHHAGQYPKEHAPRAEHGREPAWPRAGFGLPIVFHFQPRDHDDKEYQPAEPKGFELHWTDGKNLHRLASPLIVKAMPLADGRFEAIALWLERGDPEQGHVVLTRKNKELPRTRASFATMRGERDRPLFQPIREAGNVREAFLSWLEATDRARKA
jgi:CRISPR-associated protein Cmr1